MASKQTRSAASFRGRDRTRSASAKQRTQERRKQRQLKHATRGAIPNA